MISRLRLALAMSALALTFAAAPSQSAEVDWIGPNLLSNPDFETADDQGLPLDWTVTATPAGSAKFSLDQQIFLAGTTALKPRSRTPARRRCDPSRCRSKAASGTWFPSGIGARALASAASTAAWTRMWR